LRDKNIHPERYELKLTKAKGTGERIQMILRLIYLVVALGTMIFAMPEALAKNAVGLTLGGPTFITFAHGLGDDTAVEAGVSFSYNDATHIYGDYLIDRGQIFRNPELTEVSLFYGVGGILITTNKDRREKDGYYGDESGSVGLGLRIPVGLEYRPVKIQELSFHLQLVPVIAVVPETQLEFIAGLGVKYHF
jgi:hypothetical protein